MKTDFDPLCSAQAMAQFKPSLVVNQEMDVSSATFFSKICINTECHAT